MLGDIVTGHRPKEDQALSNFVLDCAKIIWNDYELHYGFETGNLLCDVGPIQAVDTICSHDTGLLVLNLIDHSLDWDAFDLLNDKSECSAEETTWRTILRENKLVNQIV